MGSTNSIPINPRELNIWVGDNPYEPVQVRDSPEQGNIQIILEGKHEDIKTGDLVTFQVGDFYVECPTYGIFLFEHFTRICLNMQECDPVDRPEIFRVPEDHELDLGQELNEH